MSNIGDFWGSSRDKISPKKRQFKLPASKFLNFFSRFFSSFWKFLISVFQRLLRLPKVLNRIDKIALLILVVILAGLAGFKINKDYLSKTKRIPTAGGTYNEILIGEAKYLNPVIAKTDTDKTINRLIYSGLTKIDKNGAIVPDLAKNWEVSADGRVYTFHLRDDVKWHDGELFSSLDVASTVEAIKDQNIKSPYFDAWKDVAVETPGPDAVIFKLKDPYGPFVYNTLVGVTPSHVDNSAISASPVGTGPYKFLKVISGKNNRIQEVIIDRSDIYYDQRPYIEKVDFKIADNEIDAKSMFDSSVNAVSGIKIEKKGVTNLSFPSSRYFGLVFNLRDEKFKDVNIRKKIKAGEKFEPEISFKLLALDKPLVLVSAEALKNDYAKQGIKIEIDKKSAIDFQQSIEKRNFQAVFYGFDSGYDRDPYPFWHSSQAATGSNFSGFSEKAADILLEDARMTVDTGVRNQKYDQFMAIINDKVPAIFLSPQDFDFSVRGNVLGIEVLKGYEPYDHFNSFADWYLKTKRVKP